VLKLKRLFLILIICFFTVFILQCERNTLSKKNGEESVYYQEKIVTGGPENFVEVHHIIIKGSNYAIGKQIAEIAQDMNIKVQPSNNRLRNKIQRKYIKDNYPIFYERMKGYADSYGIDIRDNRYDFCGLSQSPLPTYGCSVVFYPKSYTKNKHSILSRNYDFTTGTAQGKIPKENEFAMMSRPYIFELYPDKGYASISIYAFDLLGGVLDGINSEGLSVAVLAESESTVKYGNHPNPLGVGMYELLSMRYILDNCKNIQEAKEALLYLKHYYLFLPCHYIVADNTGESFIFEFSAFKNSTHIVEGKGLQYITNHPVYKYKTVDEFPKKSVLNSYERYKTLINQTRVEKKFSIKEIEEINKKVANSTLGSDNPDYAPNRTLWYSQYDLQDLSMKVRFYLGESGDSSAPFGKKLHYSDYIEFNIEKETKNN